MRPQCRPCPSAQTTHISAAVGANLIDVAVARQELSLPPTISIAQAAGFNLYMMKAMIHGDGHEVLDMAKTNLWR
jgi:pyruvate dehydrogenase (quinone)